MIAKLKQQHRKVKLMGFQEFVKQRSLTEAADIETEVSGASFIVFDSSNSAEAIDDFAKSLRNLCVDNQRVIAMAVAVD